MKIFILLFILILAPVLVSAQITNTPAADTNSVATNPAPADQAPDVVLQKLRGLIDTGKYPEAQRMVSGLLAAYPDDPRLTKAKALLDKLIAQQSASATPVVNEPATSPADQLTGMDKVDYNALIQRAREAQQTADLDQQKQLLRQFMLDSSQFLQKHPEQMLIWQFRAVSAISLDDLLDGYAAGQKLIAMGAMDSNDSNLQQLLAQLKNKGWLDKQRADAEQKQEDLAKQFSWLLGTWDVNWAWHPMPVAWHDSRGKEEFVLAGSSLEGYEINNAGTKCSEPDLRGAILDSGEIKWECYLQPYNPGELFSFRKYGGWAGSAEFGSVSQPYGFGNTDGSPEEKVLFYPSGWQPVISYAATNDIKMTIIIPSQNTNPKNDSPFKKPVTLVFTKINDAQNQPQ